MSGSVPGVNISSGKESEEVMPVAFSWNGGGAYQPMPAYQNLPHLQLPINPSPALSVPPPHPALDSATKKRGRARGYGPDVTMSSPLQNQFTPPAPSPLGNSNGEGSSVKKARGRGRTPASSNTKQRRQSKPRGPTGAGFTTHVIMVSTGEDLSSKIMSLSQHDQRAICILSASGAISNATLLHSASSIVTYEGRFEIVSLTGSFTLGSRGSQKSRTGVLNISLSGPDGRMVGGSVAGLLIAASPVQIVAGSFPDEQNVSKKVSKAPNGSTGAGSSN